MLKLPIPYISTHIITGKTSNSSDSPHTINLYQCPVQNQQGSLTSLDAIILST